MIEDDVHMLAQTGSSNCRGFCKPPLDFKMKTIRPKEHFFSQTRTQPWQPYFYVYDYVPHTRTFFTSRLYSRVFS